MSAWVFYPLEILLAVALTTVNIIRHNTKGNKMRDWTNSRTLIWGYMLARKAYYPLAISLASFASGIYIHIIFTNGIK